jgi:PST family polysaccharide transporter
MNKSTPYQPNYQPLDLMEIILKNTSAIIAGKVVIVLLSMASSIMLVRYLGSERLGHYSVLYAYLTLFSWLTTLGMEQILVRNAAQMKDDMNQIMETAVTLTVGLSVLATVLAMLGSITLGYVEGLRILLFIAAIDLLLLAPLRILVVVFQLHLKQWYGAGISIGRQLLWIIILGVLILLKAGLSGIILSRLLCSAAEALTTLFFSQRFVQFRWWHLDGILARKIIRDSWPITLYVLAAAVYHRIDQVMLYRLADARQLGYYVVAVNIVELFSIFPVALMFTMLPILAKIVLEKERLDHYISLSFRYLTILAFGVCTVVTLGSSTIIALLYGRQYSPSAPVISILIWSSFGVFLGVVINVVLLAKGLQKFIPLSASLGTVINVVLNLLLIPKWGIRGAAWATVISYSVIGAFAFLLIPATRSLAFKGIKISVFPFFTALFCIIILSPFPRPVSIALAPALYMVALFILKAWKGNDYRLICDTIRSIRTENDFKPTY